jgi:hypothetical protein
MGYMREKQVAMAVKVPNRQRVEETQQLKQVLGVEK